MQAKKETNFFIQNIERNENLKKIEMKREKKRKRDATSESTDEVRKEKQSGKYIMNPMRETEDATVPRKKRKKDKMKVVEKKDSSVASGKRAADNKKFLMNLFSGGVSSDTS